MSEIQLFTNEQFHLRTNGTPENPTFLAKDVCDILGLDNTSHALSRLDEDEKLTSLVMMSGQNRNMWFVTESGLYSLVFTSRKDESKRFKKWVTSEVLPSIRKTGGYGLSTPQTLPEALRLAADLAEKNETLQIENKTLGHKADFYDSAADSDGLITISRLAKILNHPGLGPINLFAFLREQGIFMSGDKHNIPYQKHIIAGRFKVVEVPVAYGKKINLQAVTMATVKGQAFVDAVCRKHFKANN